MIVHPRKVTWRRKIDTWKGSSRVWNHLFLSLRRCNWWVGDFFPKNRCLQGFWGILLVLSPPRTPPSPTILLCPWLWGYCSSTKQGVAKHTLVSRATCHFNISFWEDWERGSAFIQWNYCGGYRIITRNRIHSLKTHIAPKNRLSQKETIAFQPSISRGGRCVSGGVKFVTLVTRVPCHQNFVSDPQAKTAQSATHHST